MKLSFRGILSHSAAPEHGETIGNVYSFAHAKYGANPLPERVFYDQITFVNISKIFENMLFLQLIVVVTFGWK